MLLYYNSWMFYNHFIATLYHFLGLTYWPSAQCQLLFFSCFLHRRKPISNGFQTPKNCAFLDQKTYNGPEKHLGVPRGWHNPPGCTCGPRRAQVGCAPLRAPSGTSLAQQVSSGPELSSKKFHYIWTPFGIDFPWSKKQAKNNNWH